MLLLVLLFCLLCLYIFTVTITYISISNSPRRITHTHTHTRTHYIACVVTYVYVIYASLILFCVYSQLFVQYSVTFHHTTSNALYCITLHILQCNNGTRDNAIYI